MQYESFSFLLSLCKLNYEQNSRIVKAWMFVLIAHRKAPFIVGVAAGTVKHPQATFDYSFLVVKVDYI